MSNSFFSLQKYGDFVKRRCRFCEEIVKKTGYVCAFRKKDVILRVIKNFHLCEQNY